MLATAALLGASAAPAPATVDQHGYLTVRDGTELRYDVIRPDGPGPFPAVLNYEGYAAGSDASDNGVSAFTDRLLKRGYALVGVSVRGTGCSQGEFDPFAHTMGTDGYDSIEWIAHQPWSDGRVGMIGVSFGGITQLMTAADRPPHLLAIAALIRHVRPLSRRRLPGRSPGVRLHIRLDSGPEGGRHRLRDHRRPTRR
jgi:putative CocE/NonD family hydrolase